jgi:hypothetical protein
MFFSLFGISYSVIDLITCWRVGFKGHQSMDVCTKKCYWEFYFVVVAFVLVFSVIIVFAYFLVYLAKYNLLEPHFFLGIAELLHSFFFFLIFK